jgi:hypothetical protein
MSVAPAGGGAPALRLYRINTHFMLVRDAARRPQERSGYGKDLSTYALEDYSVVATS